jgi:CRISPR system Cascade subunit CasE
MSYLIRARLRSDVGGSDGALVKLVSESAVTPGKRHDLVWTLFGDTAERDRDFVFRVDDRGGRLVVMAYAPRQPDPAQQRLWDVQSRPFTPQLYPGDRIRFDLRLNPVKQHNNTRIDEVYDLFRREREAAKAANVAVPDRLNIAREVGADWLDRRAQSLGIDLDRETVKAESYTTNPVFRPGKRKPFTLSILDLKGEADVTDPSALTRALTRGIGRGRAYGCGMMMIALAG